MKVLVFTTDVPPLPGIPTSGTALRTWGMAQGLRANGHEAIISPPRTAMAALRKRVSKESVSPAVASEIKELERLSFDPSNQSALVEQIKPDVILCGHWPAMMLQTKPDQPVIIDLAGPHMLERHYQGSPNQIGAVLGKLSAISTADCFIVSGAKQRLYFLSYLLRARVPSPEERMVTIPMPLDPAVPNYQRNFHGSNSPQFVFGGVFLPWQDPSAALGHVVSRIEREKKGKFTLIGGTHPNYKIKQGVYKGLFEKLGKSAFVDSKPLLPYEDFLRELSTQEVAVDLMKWNLERELAMTIRSTTYLWSGIPTIYNDYADLGDLIRRYDAGWCVPPENPEALDKVLSEIYADPGILSRKSSNASQLAKEIFAWDVAVKPLLNFFSIENRGPLHETDIIVDFPDLSSINIQKERGVEQEFVCRINGLTKVECRLATHDRLIKDPLHFRLFAVEGNSKADNRLVAEKAVTPSEIKNNEWCGIEMPPIQDSGGKKFSLSLESSAGAIQDSVSPWAVKGSPYPLLGLYHGGKKVDHTALCFRTTCSST